MDHPGILWQLCELKLLKRERNASQKRLRDAKFPRLKTLEKFDFSAQPSLNKVLITELLRAASIVRRENIPLAGNSGTGKTHVAILLESLVAVPGNGSVSIG